jgi:gluconokinase
MAVLSFDISSGGITAALFNAALETLQSTQRQWRLELDESGAAILPVAAITAACQESASSLSLPEAIDAVCIGCFMHNCVLLDPAGNPLTPVYTWLDRRGEDAVEVLRTRMGDRFHQRTGCRYHPMFPVFKMAALKLGNPAIVERASRLVSVKAILVHQLTGLWVEDHGMASASGMYNIGNADWDSEVLSVAGVRPELLPVIADRAKL